MDWLIGSAGYAFFDYWFLAHISFWFVFGSTVAALKLNRAIFFLLGFSTALMWEVFELFAEKQWPEVWQSPERWWNAWLSDPLTVILGMWIAFLGYDYWRGVKK